MQKAVPALSDFHQEHFATCRHNFPPSDIVINAPVLPSEDVTLCQMAKHHEDKRTAESSDLCYI